MKPMLDDLELPAVQEILLHDRRDLVAFHAPGMQGSLFQNLGRKPSDLVLAGVAAGEQARDFLQKLDGKFQEGRPLPFVGDITTDTQLDEMIIANLSYQEAAGKPDIYIYILTLREYQKPNPPSAAPFSFDNPLDELETNILDEARGLVDQLVEGLNLIPDFSTGLERFVPILQDYLTRFKQMD